MGLMCQISDTSVRMTRMYIGNNKTAKFCHFLKQVKSVQKKCMNDEKPEDTNTKH